MNQAEFIEEKRKIWAKWASHYGMLFVDAFREFVEDKLEIDYHQDPGIDDLDGSIPDFVDAALILFPKRRGTSSTKKVKPEKRRRKHFERRFYLVRFVTDCWERDRRSYIPWQYVTGEWNKAHPSDQISKEVLKAEYYRALKERGIVMQLLAVKKWNNNDTFKRFLERLRKHYSVNPDTLKTYKETWLHLVMTKDGGPMLEFFKQLTLSLGGEIK